MPRYLMDEVLTMCFIGALVSGCFIVVGWSISVGSLHFQLHVHAEAEHLESDSLPPVAFNRPCQLLRDFGRSVLIFSIALLF